MQNHVWNLANASEGVCLVLGGVHHLPVWLSSTMIPTISQRRTSGRITSARRHASASLIPGRLCVLVPAANAETSEQSPELPQGESRDVQPKEWLIMLPLMVAAVMSPATCT